MLSGATNQRSAVSVYNYGVSGTGISGVSLVAAGSTYGVGSYAQQGVIEQTGPSTSALVFSKILGDGSSRTVTGRIFQSGAWSIGDLGTSSNSYAQAGLSGPLLTFGSVGGSLTTTGGQATIFKTWGGGADNGTLYLQANTSVNLMSATTTVAGTTTTKFITFQGRRVKVTSVTSATASPFTITASDEIISVNRAGLPTPDPAITINLPASPTAGDTYTIKDANGTAGIANITVSGNGKNIDGGYASIVLMTNYTQATFVYNGTIWISSLTNNISPNSGYTSVVNVPSGTGANVVGLDELLLCDPTSAVCTVTAPSTPLPNLRFTVKDATFKANVNAISVDGNGATLENPTSLGTYGSPISITTAGLSATWAYDPTRLRYTLVSKVV